MYSMLIVEDEDIIRAGIRKIVEGMKLPIAPIAEASGGRQALQLAKEQRFDLLITDIRMEDGDGLDLLRNLARADLHSKAIILSGYGEFAYAQQAISLGVCEYLLKPIKRSKLQDTLTHLIAQLDKEQAELEVGREVRPGSEDSEEAVRALPYDNNAITFITAYIDEHYAEDLTLRAAADQVFMNPSYFSSLFKKKTGINFIAYVQRVRIEKSKELLRNPQYKIYEVATKVGFADEKYFFKVFKNIAGVTPNEFRDGY